MKLDRYVQIDEEGYPHFEGVRVVDDNVGREILTNLTRNDSGLFSTQAGGVNVLVEAFDEPLVAKQVHKSGPGVWELLFPYDFRALFSLESLKLDEWDRFHGYTQAGIPFLLSRVAQAELFNLVDEFSDDSLTCDGKTYTSHSWLTSNKEAVPEDFWTDKYRQEEPPPWDLDGPHPALAQMIPQLKVSKCRILVLGCGAGHDAAFFAELGHIVTAIDISPLAIAKAKERYGSVKNLTFAEQDIFALNMNEYRENFDIVFEHTCFCAIDPERRNDLIKVWKTVLAPEGNLLGIFFSFDRPKGPPYGGNEWEVRERLRKDFSFLYWNRWRHSPDHRHGKEFVVYAKVRK